MKYLLSILFTCIAYLANAQTNPILMPVNLVDGSLFDLVQDLSHADAIRKAGLKCITTFFVEGRGNRSDTFRYKEIFSIKGDQIFYHQEFKDFDGYNTIRYNKDGTIAEKQWKNTHQMGCYTGGITDLEQENHTHYTYHKKKLILKVTSTKTEGGRWHDSLPVPGLHTAYNYNKKGLNTAVIDYYLPEHPGQDTTKYIRNYRYNSDGKIFQVYHYESYNSPPQHIMDSLVNTASDQLSTILLRQSPQWEDTVKAYTFPEADDESIEAYQARMDAIDLRDSADDVALDFYESDKNSFDDFVGYDYNSKGLLVSKMHFKKTTLSLKDTLIYNDRGQLVTWESWHLEADNDPQPWEHNGFSRLPVHDILTFIYDKKGRVINCILKHFESPPLHRNDGKYDFMPEKEITYNVQYDAFGKAERVQENTTSWNYGFNPDLIPPITHDTRTFYINYEKW